MKSKEEIEQLARNVHFDMHTEGLNAEGCFNQLQGYIKGYTHCQEDMSDKKYTEEDIRKAIQYGIDIEAGNIKFDYKKYPDSFTQYLQSLNKQD